MTRITAEAIEQMRDAMARKAHTYGDLSLITGLSKTSVSRWVKAMRALEKVRIGDWDEDVRGRTFVPMWVMVKKKGEKDVPRPTPAKTAAIRMRNWRARQKAATK